jgi:hypothetical protein
MDHQMYSTAKYNLCSPMITKYILLLSMAYVSQWITKCILKLNIAYVSQWITKCILRLNIAYAPQWISKCIFHTSYYCSSPLPHPPNPMEHQVYPTAKYFICPPCPPMNHQVHLTFRNCICSPMDHQVYLTIKYRIWGHTWVYLGWGVHS